MYMAELVCGNRNLNRDLPRGSNLPMKLGKVCNVLGYRITNHFRMSFLMMENIFLLELNFFSRACEKNEVTSKFYNLECTSYIHINKFL